MTVISHQVRLAAHLQGAPAPTDFALCEAQVPEPAEGQALLRVLWASVDPCRLGRLGALAVGHVVRAASAPDTVAEVVASRHPDYTPGDVVLAHSGWQTWAVEDGATLRKLDPAIAPVSTALGVLGTPGFTAYAGLRKTGRPKSGETVVVSSAAGPVGATVGQIAKLLGARVVGITDGAARTSHVEEDLGFDIALDYRAPGFAQRLAAAVPDGVDVYWENLGAATSVAVFGLLNRHAQVIVQGLGQDDYREELYAEFLRDVSGWIREGVLTYREDVAEGLANAPEAFIRTLAGESSGQVVVKVA